MSVAHVSPVAARTLPLVEDALSSIERAVTQLEEGHADTCMLEEALSSLTRAAAQLELV